MNNVLGKAEIKRPQIPKPQIYSHGSWPVKKLQVGQSIRFYSKNFGREVIMQIEKLRLSEQKIIITGIAANDVAFNLNETVEIVSVEEMGQNTI